MHCPHCSQEHPDTSRFCPVTGETITLPDQSICKKCGETIQADLKFCPFCGSTVTTARINFLFPALMILGAIVIIAGIYFTWKNLDLGKFLAQCLTLISRCQAPQFCD